MFWYMRWNDRNQPIQRTHHLGYCSVCSKNMEDSSQQILSINVHSGPTYPSGRWHCNLRWRVLSIPPSFPLSPSLSCPTNGKQSKYGVLKSLEIIVCLYHQVGMHIRLISFFFFKDSSSWTFFKREKRLWSCSRAQRTATLESSGFYLLLVRPRR